MRFTSVARRLRSFPRMSVTGVKFEPDELGGESLVIEGKVRGRSVCSRCGRKCPRYDRWNRGAGGTWTSEPGSSTSGDGCGA